MTCLSRVDLLSLTRNQRTQRVVVFYLCLRNLFYALRVKPEVFWAPFVCNVEVRVEVIIYSWRGGTQW
jgi:hypothetical protein